MRTLLHLNAICIGNPMNASGIKDLNYDLYLKILSKFYEPLDKCNLKGFFNIMSSVNH